jgi:perosamine synthetase
MIQVPISRPDLGDEEVAATERVLRSGWIMQGPEVGAFEAELAAFLDAPHVVAVANGTVALELALRALGIGPGDEVVTVSHSFIATANCVLAVGARPVFVDVDERKFGMDPRHVAAALGPQTKAVLCAHQLGFPCDVEGIVAAARGLPVIEDAACAIGSELGGVRIGRPHATLATFSFHPRKVVTTGEGGAVTTADETLATRVRALRQHGTVGGRFVLAGTNARMTDLQAAVGRPQLARLGRTLEERRRQAAVYARALADHPSLAPASAPLGTNPNWQSYPARVRPGASQLAIMQALAAAGVATRPGLTNAHLEPVHADARVAPGGLVISEHLSRSTVLLPLFHGMTPEEETSILSALSQLSRS